MDDTEREPLKLIFDLFRHLTTIDTGAIVILATFFAKSFDKTSMNWLVIVFVITILISLVGCVIGMFLGASSMAMMNEDFMLDEKTNILGATMIVFGISFVFFVIGIISLGAFVIVNIMA